MNGRTWTRLAPIFTVWISIVLMGSAGLFSKDELIYLASARAFADRFSLSIENGYTLFPTSSAVRLDFLVPGPLGLAPQYPSGYPIVSAPLARLAGARGLMLVNALASIGTIILTYRFSTAIFEKQSTSAAAALILALSSYLGDYALGVWPQAVGALIVLTSTFLVWEAVHRDGRSGWCLSFAAAFILGFGILIRVDIIFVAPALAMWAIIFAPRPLELILPALLGAAPGLVVATALNAAKFDIYSPITYGYNEGGVDPRSYATFAVLVLAAIGLCFLLRFQDNKRQQIAILFFMCLFLLILCLYSPVVMHTFKSIFRGFYFLSIDFGAASTDRTGVRVAMDGATTLGGLPKKALGQSLPWVGILVLLAVYHWDRRERRAHLLFCLVILVWITPFARRGWSGGIAGNMRYFLPIVPHLAILAASAWDKMEAHAEFNIKFINILMLSSAILSAIVVGLVLSGLSPIAYIEQFIPIYVLVALAGSGLIAGAGGRAGRWALVLCRGLFACALLLGFILGVVDIETSQMIRGVVAARSDKFEEVPEHSLILCLDPKEFYFQLRRKRSVLALANTEDWHMYLSLIDDALRHGLRVFVQSDELSLRLQRISPDIDIRLAINGDLSMGRLWEVQEKKH